MQLPNITRIISLIGVCALAVTTTRAVDPPPDGGYPGQNTAEGDSALFNLDTSQGTANTAIGFQALFSNTTGGDNTASGYQALFSNTSGNNNTATGWIALFSNTTGALNTANGLAALSNNTSGNDNTADGAFALTLNTSGSENTASGKGALTMNTTGSDNTAGGVNALLSNTNGNNNTAYGFSALFSNTTGEGNTATGVNALQANTIVAENNAYGINALSHNQSGTDNVANGLNALLNNTTGNFNTAQGANALLANPSGSNNTAIGVSALDANSGSSNIGLGALAGANLTSGSNNIDIGNAGVPGESNKIRIGTRPAQKATFIAGISGVTVANGVGVIINSQGQLGTVVSSERFKDAIKPMEKASEVILALQPVTFRYKHELDPTGIPQFGLVAEQVEKVDPDLVARDEQGKPYTVRYEAVNAMLLNEFLKEHRKVEEQEHKLAVQDSKSKEQNATIIELKSALAQQQQQIGLLTSQMQRVSDQLTANETAPAMVVKNR
jgi:uncharacterized coiled-coil protein SlyX